MWVEGCLLRARSMGAPISSLMACAMSSALLDGAMCKGFWVLWRRCIRGYRDAY